MARSIEWPQRRSPRRGRRFVWVLALFALLAFGGRRALSYYVDELWFSSLGYGGVFWKTLGLQWAVFAVFGAATFFILYGTFLALKRACLSSLPSSHTILVGGQPLQLPIESVLRILGPGASLVIAALTGAGMMAEWPTLALYWTAPRAGGGVVDPIFGKPLSFYLFTLPAWQLINGWLLSLAVIACGLAISFIVMTSGGRAMAERQDSYIPLPWRGFSITFAFLLLFLALRLYISRFEQLFEDHTIFGGVTYVKHTSRLPACSLYARRS